MNNYDYHHIDHETISFTYLFNYDTWTICIKKDFLNICPNPHMLENYDLIKMGIQQYMHNIHGPAINCHSDSTYCLYVVNGVRCSNKEEWEKLASTYKFNNKLKDILYE